MILEYCPQCLGYEPRGHGHRAPTPPTWRCPSCGTTTPSNHYRNPCPGDKTLGPIRAGQ